MVLLMATMALGLLFLVNKGFEWGTKIEHGIYPNSPTLLARAKGEILFFGLYYVMTGLHGLHVLVGVCVLCWDVDARCKRQGLIRCVSFPWKTPDCTGTWSILSGSFSFPCSI